METGGVVVRVCVVLFDGIVVDQLASTRSARRFWVSSPEVLLRKKKGGGVKKCDYSEINKDTDFLSCGLILKPPPTSNAVWVVLGPSIMILQRERRMEAFVACYAVVGRRVFGRHVL